MKDRFHRFLLAADRQFVRLLVLLGLAVEYLAAADPSWALVLGKWGGLATVAIGFASFLLKQARDKAPPP